MKIAIQGEPGAYSESAAKNIFGSRHKIVPLPQFEDVFRAVDSGLVNRGVVPIENSLAGSIRQNYDLLNKYNLQIHAETYLRVEHVLMCHKKASNRSLIEVRSHPHLCGPRKIPRRCNLVFVTSPPRRADDGLRGNESDRPRRHRRALARPHERQRLHHRRIFPRERLAKPGPEDGRQRTRRRRIRFSHVGRISAHRTDQGTHQSDQTIQRLRPPFENSDDTTRPRRRENAPGATGASVRSPLSRSTWTDRTSTLDSRREGMRTGAVPMSDDRSRGLAPHSLHQRAA